MGSSVLFLSRNFVNRHLFGFEIPPTILLSFFALLVVIAIAAMGLVGDGAKGLVNPTYIFAFYFLQACAVIIMAPIGFAFVTKWVPMERSGRLTGVWFFATGLGSFLGGYAKNVIDNDLSPLYLYEVFVLVIFCAAMGLLAIDRLIIKMVGQ